MSRHHKHHPRPWPDEPRPLAASVIDNHTHLPLSPHEVWVAEGERVELEEQLERAARVGVTRMITSACQWPEYEPSITLARAHSGIRVAAAIHPNDVAIHAGFADPSPDGQTPEVRDCHIPLDEAFQKLLDIVEDPMVVAVGESGLDYYRTAESGRRAQQDALREHIRLAAAKNLPLQIHDRDAHADCLQILSEDAAPGQPVVFHCFSGDAEMGSVLAEHGWYASFSGSVTYPANQDLRAALATLPRSQVLVETDAPYLTPVPWRGCPNASYVMAHTVRFMAEVWELSEEVTCRILHDNTTRVYGTWPAMAVTVR